MVANGFRDVILELPLFLKGLLGNVDIGAKRRIGEGYERRADAAGDEVVPVLIAKREWGNGRVRKNRVPRKVAKDQMVLGGVAGGEVACGVGLVGQAVVDVTVVAEIDV